MLTFNFLQTAKFDETELQATNHVKRPHGGEFESVESNLAKFSQTPDPSRLLAAVVLGPATLLSNIQRAVPPLSLPQFGSQ